MERNHGGEERGERVRGEERGREGEERGKERGRGGRREERGKEREEERELKMRVEEKGRAKIFFAKKAARQVHPIPHLSAISVQLHTFTLQTPVGSVHIRQWSCTPSLAGFMAGNTLT